MTAHVPDLLWPLALAYALTLGVLFVFGAHRAWLVWLHLRHCGPTPAPSPHSLAQRPAVTVQLPLFNEPEVAARVIEAACAMDWPRERVQVQVLDDSTDETRGIVDRCAAALRAAGHDVCVLRRSDRTGFKAGALEAGLLRAKGEFVAVFDADFVPPPDFLLGTVPHFDDAVIGMVQARWGHLNRDQSILTRAQAAFLDGHFVVEHGARSRTGRWMNFNGTAGVWRRAAIEDAGGWQHDTITEDLDLSYRAQLRGWRFVFLREVVCPGELPPRMDAFRTQQHRWTKGSVQTARKLLPAILRSRAPAATRLEALFHLTSPAVYPCVVMLTLLYFPAHVAGLRAGGGPAAAVLATGTALLGLATASAAVFYVTGQAALGRSAWRALLQLPSLIALGVGISLNNAVGVIEALVGKPSPFVRTPKYGGSDSDAGSRSRSGPRRLRVTAVSALEMLTGLYLVACLALSLSVPGAWAAAPLLVVFALGFLGVGAGGTRAPRS